MKAFIIFAGVLVLALLMNTFLNRMCERIHPTKPAEPKPPEPPPCARRSITKNGSPCIFCGRIHKED